MDIVLASCLELPEPDPDEAPLSAALRDAGYTVEVQGWDDPAANFQDAKCVLIRATWNYPQHHQAFSRWIEDTAAHSLLLNSASLVNWSLHKRYLLDLSNAGVRTTPTALITRGSTSSLAQVIDERGWDSVVVKPAISASSFRTLKVTRENRAEGQAHLAALLLDRDVLIQPYLEAVEGYGERALVWIDGEVTHAVRKSTRWQDGEEQVSDQAVTISDEERQLAHAAMKVARRYGDPLYGRIDMTPGNDGRGPMVMELELIEPSLFLVQGPAGLQRLVTALGKRLSGRSTS